MVVLGAGGFFKDLMQTLTDNNEQFVLFDNTGNPNDHLFNHQIIKTIDNVKSYFEHVDNRFALGIGNPIERKRLSETFIELGGLLTSTVHSKADISTHDVSIGRGSNILQQSIISNSVNIGVGSIIYYQAVLAHDVKLGDYVEISPKATILGGCTIGDLTHIGANATILPRIKIGSNVTVGAGSVVTKDVVDNCVIAGVPAAVIKWK